MELSPQQQEAVDAIKRWYESDPYGPFRLFAPAGCGKTTLARQVPEVLGFDEFSPKAVQYAAYTGKAASVLRRKGCTPANTLHSLIYRPVENPEAEQKLEEARKAEAPEAVIAQLEKEARGIGFEWNEDSILASARLLILDEVSMVDAKLAADIERFEIPVLVLGDPAQLEPIGGEGYYIDAAPDFALTEVHRQALESPVLELATRIRTSTDINLGLTRADVEKRSLAAAMEHDQVICWRNATRWSLIDKIRTKLGYPRGRPVAGDRVMCLTNNKSLGIFNGQQFDVTAVKSDRLTLLDDEGRERAVDSHPEGFQGRKAQDDAKALNLGMRGKVGLFTFAQAITCHKAQGSEWDSVYVVDETRGLISMTAERKGLTEGIAAGRRWGYTAVSRAATRVTVAR